MVFLKKLKLKRLNKKIKALKHNRLSSQVTDEVLKKERTLYHQMIKIYKKLVGKKKFPFANEMIIECLRASADIDDQEAQFKLAETILEEAKFRDKLEKEGVFSSESNKKTMDQLYEEVHYYLKAAENLNSIQAKRIRGLCYVNGWGVETDQKQGFKLIMESIEQEKAWDKVPQIFGALGLNKPEFFAQLSEMRKEGS